MRLRGLGVEALLRSGLGAARPRLDQFAAEPDPDVSTPGGPSVVAEAMDLDPDLMVLHDGAPGDDPGGAGLPDLVVLDVDVAEALPSDLGIARERDPVRASAPEHHRGRHCLGHRCAVPLGRPLRSRRRTGVGGDLVARGQRRIGDGGVARGRRWNDFEFKAHRASSSALFCDVPFCRCGTCSTF